MNIPAICESLFFGLIVLFVGVLCLYVPVFLVDLYVMR